MPFLKDDMKENKDGVKKQVMYLGRWVDRENFRAFVYKIGKEAKLAKSYDEFESLIATGIWFDSIENVPKEEVKLSRKTKNEPSISDS